MMTFRQRLYSFFVRTNQPDVALSTPATPSPLLPTPPTGPTSLPETNPVELAIPDLTIPLPHWLTDEETLRDEGVLFGLSEVQPDEKVNEIRAFFAQQTVALDHTISWHGDLIAALNRSIGQRETRLADLQQRNRETPEPAVAPRLIWTTLRVGLLVVMCLGAFYLIDETLRPSIANRWITVGLFLAGMFNLFGQPPRSTDTPPPHTFQSVVGDLGLPLTASVFVLVQALQTQPVWQALALFSFVFFLFVVGGRRLSGLLAALQHDLQLLLANGQQRAGSRDAEIATLNRQLNALRAEQRPHIAALHRAETELARVNARRDQLVNLFLSEFELARSLRDRLTEQQRAALFN